MPVYPGARKRWTAREDSALIRRYRDGEHPRAIADSLHRTKGSITDRLIKKHGVDWQELVEDKEDSTGTTKQLPEPAPRPATRADTHSVAGHLSSPARTASSPIKQNQVPTEESGPDKLPMGHIASMAGYRQMGARQIFMQLPIAGLLAERPAEHVGWLLRQPVVRAEIERQLRAWHPTVRRHELEPKGSVASQLRATVAAAAQGLEAEGLARAVEMAEIDKEAEARRRARDRALFQPKRAEGKAVREDWV